MIPNPLPALYYSEHIHIAQTWTSISTPYFCIVQESESVTISESGNAIKPAGEGLGLDVTDPYINESLEYKGLGLVEAVEGTRVQEHKQDKGAKAKESP